MLLNRAVAPAHCARQRARCCELGTHVLTCSAREYLCQVQAAPEPESEPAPPVASAPEPESVAGPTFITDEEPTAADVARALCTIEERKHDAAAVVTMMRANEGCAPVQRAGAICGRTAATREEGRAGEAAVARSGAPATAGRPCTASHACTAVCAASAGIWALFALSSGEQAARASVVDAGGAEVVAVLMLVYPAALGMQEKGCRVRWRRASMGDQGDFLLSAFSSANSCRVSENHSTALVAPRFILPSTSHAQKSLGLPPLQLWVPPITPLSRVCVSPLAAGGGQSCHGRRAGPRCVLYTK